MPIFDDLFPWRKLAQQHETMLMKLSQLDEVLVGLGTTLNKAKDEILDKITALENALRDVDISDEAITRLIDEEDLTEHGCVMLIYRMKQ